MRLVPTEERYPVQSLLDALGCRTINQARDRHGLQLWEYVDRGLTELVADRLAVRVGLHPAMVWPTWVDDGLSVVDRQFVETGWRTAWLFREAS